MEDNPTQKNATKTIKSKNNNIFEEGRQPQFFLNGRRPKKHNAT